MRRLFTFLFVCMDAVSRLLSFLFGDGRVEFVRRFVTKLAVVVGPICLVFGLGFLVSTVIFLRRSDPTTGVVVNLIPHRDAEDGSVGYAPVFAFTASDGAPYVVSSNVSSNPAGFAVGDHVPVRYEIHLPQKARIDSFWQMWLMPFVFGTIGLVWTMAGVFLSAYDRWLNRRGLSVVAG